MRSHPSGRAALVVSNIATTSPTGVDDALFAGIAHPLIALCSSPRKKLLHGACSVNTTRSRLNGDCR
ncbi:Hypothetical predicted protein [Drosophila guanche]|uniref:Uncharacterized protein n=1 Tax=Drosophila guanche TaxID=7266 RepID=A0A3B0KTG5_DROGU|nr:Hypothetical predicted protein [Drosophila guanche]